MLSTNADTSLEHSLLVWQEVWEPALHKTPEQIARLCSAQKVKSSKIELLSTGDGALLYGSATDPYNVTLDSCDCTDFHFRRKPCKHIYCLAITIGLLKNIPVYNKKLASTYDFQTDVDRFYLLYTEGIITGEQYANIAKVLLK